MTTMNIKPSDEYLAACRLVLGGDTPDIVLGAISNRDPRMAVVEALAVRDPKQWLCSAIDENGIPRLWAKGATEQEARKTVELEVTKYRDRKQAHREMVPRASWRFDIYPPDVA
jgi:hypothetical protein